MNVRRLKKRHWLPISFGLGLLVGYLHIAFGGFSPARSVTPSQFESMLLSPPLKVGNNFVRDVTIFPAKDGSNMVRFEVLTATAKPGEWEYIPRQMEAPIPYPPTANAPSTMVLSGADYTVVAYLKSLKQRMPKISYAFAWWASPAMTLGLWTTGSVLVVGLLFPMLVSLLIDSGFGAKTADRAYDLDRFVSEKCTDGIQPAGNDQSQLDQVISGLEEQLGRSSKTTAESKTQATSMSNSAPVSLATEDNSERIAPADQNTEEHFQGDFYPTALSTSKPRSASQTQT
jgi:hypothetical protein